MKTVISVSNGSRQIDNIVDGQRKTSKVLSEAGLPKGVFDLDNSLEAKSKVYAKTYSGQILHTDKNSVFQLSEGKIIKHDSDLFKKPPEAGQGYSINYKRGIGKVEGEIEQSKAQELSMTKARKQSL